MIYLLSSFLSPHSNIGDDAKNIVAYLKVLFDN
jgi:hypothetical protein